MGKLNLAAIKATAGTAPSATARKPELVDPLSVQGESAPATETRSESEFVNMVFRATPRFRRELKRWAVDEDISIQALIVSSLQAARRARGLPELPE